MGLDMYLTAVLDVEEKQEELQILFPEVESIETVSTTIGYWRKANAIHAWFVNNVQGGEDDCRLYNVCNDDIQSLLELVNNVIEKKQKPEEVLPSMDGFFFGKTDYDEYYYEDLVHTKTILEHALRLNKSGWRVKYQSSL
jgi:hypothetical protein